jgi:hypothetical protein
MFSINKEDHCVVESNLSIICRGDLTVSFVAFFDSSIYVAAVI